MKKFVTLFAAVAAFSFVSCGEAAKKAEEVKDSVAVEAVEVVEPVAAAVDSAATVVADSVAAL